MNASPIYIPGERVFNPIAQRRAAGAIIVNGNHIADTLQCVHGGEHWIPIYGSGRKRGYCISCQGPLCGKKLCLEKCTPYKKLKYE